VSERKPGHRRRARTPGESRSPKLPAVRCKALNKAGEPCRSPSVRSDGFCVAHSPMPMSNGEVFGSPEQTRKSATGVSKRFPKLTEIVERELEAKAEEIIKAHLEGLIATRTHVDAKGGEHVSPDHDTRWRSAAALLDRALGKASSSDETAASPSVNVDIRLIEDPLMRDRARDLLQAISDSRTAGKFGPGV
jgi:hypothetical protein